LLLKERNILLCTVIKIMLSIIQIYT